MNKEDKLRKIDQQPAITGGGSAPIVVTEVIAPPQLGVIPPPYDLVLVGQSVVRSAQAAQIAVSIAWKQPVSATPEYYIVEYDTVSTFDNDPQRARANQTSGVFFVAPSTTYYFRVKCAYRTITSEYTDTLTVVTIADTTPPPDITGLSAAFSNSNLIISWTIPNSEIYKNARVRIWNAARTILYATYYTSAPSFVWTAEENLRATGDVGITSVSVDVTSNSWSNTLGNPVITSATASAPPIPSGVISNWIGDDGRASADTIVSWLASINADRYTITLDGFPKITKDLRYTYLYDNNVTDHRPTLASGKAAFNYTLTAHDRLGQTSATLSGTFSNIAPPSALYSLETTIGFSYIAAQVIVKSGVLDFDHFEWTVKLSGTPVQTFPSTTPDVIISNLVSGTYSVEVKAVDKFNQKSTAITQTGLAIDTLTIAELRADAYYSDSDNNTFTAPSSGTLAVLKDDSVAAGVSYAA